MSYIKENIAILRQRIVDAAKRVGRNPANIKLIAVTKTVEAIKILEAIDNGIIAVGENKVQELIRKKPEIDRKVEWHLIGHLQSNKVKYIINEADLIHSVESISLAKEISKRAQKIDRIMPVLVQVNVSKEESKTGLDIKDTEEFINEISKYSCLKVKGLMTMAPHVKETEKIRPLFKELRLLADKINNKNLNNISLDCLSMGMSNDFEVAIEEGATLVRVGTSIFGERNYNI